MVSQVAKEVFNVKKVLARVKNPNREVIFKNLSIDTICPTLLAVEEFIKQAKE
jgi:trk system potassium uptake protein TrkA